MLKKWLSHIEKPIVKFFLFSCFDGLVGAIGMIVYGILTATYGPIWVRNQFFGLWLTSAIFFHSIQSIYVEVRSWNSKIYYYIDLVFFISSTVLPLLLIIFYGISIRIDAIIWSIYLFAVNLTNIYILFARRKNLDKMLLKNQQELESNLNSLSKPTNNERKSTKRNYFSTFLKIINFILRLFFIIIFCLLLSGAITEGVGKINYPARGKFVDVKISNKTDKTVKFHFLCDGPKNGQPIFLFEGSGSHGLADYLSLQMLLKQNNRRSCIWDKPGLGYSDYLLTDMKDYNTIYNNLISSLDEKGPFEFIGWGGGNQVLYEYAYFYPKMFKSLTFIDGSPNNIEFKIPYILKNWTKAEYDRNKNKVFESRKNLFKIINGIGVPFGLMSLIISPYKTYFQNLEKEVNWYFQTEKTWITQEYLLESVFSDQDVFEMYKINQSIPINLIMTIKSDEQIKNQVCKPKGFDFNSAECKYEIDSNNLSIELRKNLYNLSQNGKIFNCTFDECNLGYFIEKGANYTIDKLLQI